MAQRSARTQITADQMRSALVGHRQRQREQRWCSTGAARAATATAPATPSSGASQREFDEACAEAQAYREAGAHV